MKKPSIILFVFLLLLADQSFAQDVHFSQFYESPVLLNPATSGASPSDFRLALNYRNQWQNILSPFQTIGLAFDSKLKHLNKKEFNHFGYGLSMYTDKAGRSHTSTNQISGSIAYHLYFNRRDIISFGVNAGMFQKVINTSSLKWDAQFNGKTYDPSLSSQENSNYQSIAKFDLGVGLLYRHQEASSGISYEAGFAMNHLTKPNISYYQSEKAFNNFKYTVTGGAKLKLQRGIYLLPATLIALQSKHTEISAGSNIRFESSDNNKEKNMLATQKGISTGIQFGAFYRVKDAVIFTAMVEYDHHINIGLSYDVNVSKLKSASRFRGGYEVCLVLTERKHNSKLRTKH